MKAQLKSLCLGSLPRLSQATWVIDPVNSICTFRDSDPYSRPQLLTPGWTDTNVLTGITGLNVWNVGRLTNLSWIIIFCRAVFAFPKACSLEHTGDVSKGDPAKSVWKWQVKQSQWDVTPKSCAVPRLHGHRALFFQGASRVHSVPWNTRNQHVASV